ncbi:MAG: hypothetical protein GYB33_08825 [Gammaproteobacteria bacterium]|uniref:hypothetical protein n=1 Tax=Pseudomaricurvus alcaniphilus TaxID=1166482 RepID=UPI001408A600|nr:hypothetical protein [Pseudomaricurvus alcaniphilus]MBR9910437.1 hypothetical protein [Gammaproteobacteria bacterium]NHN36165.1 hypothetical protein [Pseudomaricurvus alcaniphilus]
MMNIKKYRAPIAIALATLMGASLAHSAVPRPNVFDGGNRWRITYYNDPTAGHSQWATQILCFLPYAQIGTSIQGTWYSLTFPDWNGRYYQEGDEVKMTGDYANDVGHDHMTLFHTTNGRRDMAFKDWTEWRENGGYGRIIGWGNTRMVRDGRCPVAGHVEDGRKVSTAEIKRFEAEADQLSKSLPERLTTQGENAQFPGQPRLERVETYLERTGLGELLK